MKWIATLLVLCVAPLLAGCGAYWESVGRNLSTGAVSGASSGASKQQLGSIASGTIAAARDELFGDKTQQGVKVLAAGARRQLLGPETAASLAQLREDLLGAPLRNDADSLRETLVGAPLREDLKQAVAEVGPALNQQLQVVLSGQLSALKSDADQELPKLERIVYGAVAVIVALIALIGLLLWEAHKHRKVLERMVEKL